MLGCEIGGRRVETIEGVAKNGDLHPLQQKFLEHAALQCGICTPGFIVAGKALPLVQASEDLRFAAAVAAFAQQLKGGQYTGDFSLADSAALARGARGDDRFGLRGEFVQLVELAQSLQTPAPSHARKE